MNKRKAATVAALVALISYPLNTYALKTTPVNQDLEISFEHANAYSDIDADLGNDDRNVAAIQKVVVTAFQKEANKYLPDGYKLKVTVSDIDLAGDRSPLTSTYGDYRVYTDMFPPKIHFDYALYDPQENLIASGTKYATDLAYTYNIMGARTWSEEEAPYVAELVRGWASTELRRAVKQK